MECWGCGEKGMRDDSWVGRGWRVVSEEWRERKEGVRVCLEL